MIFDFFKKRDYTNVVKFPETKTPYIAPPTPEPETKTPYIAPPTPEPETKVFYRIGVTDNDRLAFQVGYSELTMTRKGVQHLIEQLQVFRDQLTDSEDKE